MYFVFEDVMALDIDKNIIMCLSPGRSGTKLLTLLLGLADDTCSVHEAEPTFQAVTESVRKSVEDTERFVRDVKLPVILSMAETNYVETSHLFGKGVFEVFIELHLPFRLIILNREPREVAKSLWRIKAIPGRTKKKQHYLLHPAHAGVMKLPHWDRMTNYQLCFWYCLEMERRKELYAAQCRECGIPVVEINLKDLMAFKRLSELCGALNLNLPKFARAAHKKITAKKVNRKARYLPNMSLRPLATQERQVWDALAGEGEQIYTHVSKRYGWEDVVNTLKKVQCM